jgi:AraC family transcriptional regulator
MKPDSMNALLPCSSVPLVSSVGLGWRGLVLERHYSSPCEIPEIPIARHIVEFASGQHASYGERPGQDGRFQPYSKEPETINFYSAGVRPAIRAFTRADLLLCGLDTDFVQEIAGELESGFIGQLRAQMAFRDEALGSILRLLEGEARSGKPSHRLYVDHLAYALTLRLFSLGKSRRESRLPKGGLPLHILRRVIERMNANLSTDLDLKTLAAESGYSRNHFLRMFRAATECTPHRYFLRLRIERAQSMMKNRSLRLIDIAEACGFASQTQFSRVFRQILGITPNQYRRDILSGLL